MLQSTFVAEINAVQYYKLAKHRPPASYPCVNGAEEPACLVAPPCGTAPQALRAVCACRGLSPHPNKTVS